MKRVALLFLFTALCLPQSSVQLVTPDIRRVGDRLACKCGVCNNTVGTCAMLECHYSLPARKQIASMLQEGKSDDDIVASFVRERGIVALAAPPREGFSLLGYIMPFAAIVAGLGMIFLYLRRFRPAPAPTAPGVDKSVLDRYRDRIDRETADLEG